MSEVEKLKSMAVYVQELEGLQYVNYLYIVLNFEIINTY